MKLDDFKDRLFDVLNESEDLNVSDIRADDVGNTFSIGMADGSVFEIKCKKIFG